MVRHSEKQTQNARVRIMQLHNECNTLTRGYAWKPSPLDNFVEILLFSVPGMCGFDTFLILLFLPLADKHVLIYPSGWLRLKIVVLLNTLM